MVESIVSFFDKLVGNSTWKRAALLAVLLLLAVIAAWTYEYFTARARIARMEFAADHLKKLADPELKSDIQGDAKLEIAHEQMKDHLIDYLESTRST